MPATALYVVVNIGLQPDFQSSTVRRRRSSRAVGMAVKVDTRLMLDRAYRGRQAQRHRFNVASIPPDFNAPSRGAFDPEYMNALFQVGETQGKGARPFASEPPPYSSQPMLGQPDNLRKN